MQDIDEVLSQLSLLMAEQAKLLQPFPTGEMFQAPNHLCPPLDPVQEFHISLVLRSSEWETAVLTHLTRTSVER